MREVKLNVMGFCSTSIQIDHINIPVNLEYIVENIQVQTIKEIEVSILLWKLVKSLLTNVFRISSSWFDNFLHCELISRILLFVGVIQSFVLQ
jgi:hypothetical protein